MSNALEPLFDLFWDSGAIFFRWLFDGWIKPKTDFEPIFNETKLYNTSKAKPLLVNENNTERTQTYIFSIPTGLTISDFVARKHGLQEITYAHPLLEPVLKDTYGTIVYQEQIMQVFQVLADYSLGQADQVRRIGLGICDHHLGFAHKETRPRQGIGEGARRIRATERTVSIVKPGSRRGKR